MSDKDKEKSLTIMDPPKSEVSKEEQTQLFDHLYQEQSLEIESLYRSINYVENLQEDQHQGPILENRSKHLYMSWSSITSRHYRLHQIATPEVKKIRSYFTKKCYEHLEERYLNITDLISLWMTQCQNQQSSNQLQLPNVSTQEGSNIKLPTIKIPTFSGKFTDWVAFRDSFQSLVIDRNSLLSLEKLHYLKSSVQGDANELICNVPLNATNFKTAWTLLETRYSNIRGTVNAHLNEIFSLELLKKESATQLLMMRNVINRNLSALQNLKRPNEFYSDILINRVVVNLDFKTQRDWN